MFNETLQKVRERLERYKRVRVLIDMLQRTPLHAVHWYVLIIMGIGIACISVAIAWFTFTGVAAKDTDAFEDISETTTIKRDDLKEAVDAYRAREIEFRMLQENPPRIVDPGR